MKSSLSTTERGVGCSLIELLHGVHRVQKAEAGGKRWMQDDSGVFGQKPVCLQVLSGDSRIY